MVSHKDVNYAIRAFASLTAISSVLNRMTCAVVLIALHSTETKSYNQRGRAGFKRAAAIVWLDTFEMVHNHRELIAVNLNMLGYWYVSDKAFWG